MKKLLILAIIPLLLFACKGKPTDPANISVTLDWTPNTNHTGLYVAQELGYFAEEGLNVDILQPGQGITDQIVATGKSHFGVSYQENVIRAQSEDIPLVSIAAVIQHNTSGFASLKDSGIKSVKDFEGKRYGSWDSPSEVAILKNVMDKHGADFDKVKIVSGIYDFFSTIGKEADFEWIYYGWDGVYAQTRGIEMDYIPLRELNPIFDYYTPVIISSEKYLAENPETTAKFIKAVQRGYEYCIAEPEKSAAILLTHVPELNEEQVQHSLQYLAKEYRSDAKYWGFQDRKIWEDFAGWMADEELIAKPIDIDKAFSNAYFED